MPIFEYKGVSNKGKQVSGVKDIDSARSLKELLRRDGIFLTQYAEQSRTGGKKSVVKGEGVRAKGSREVDVGRFFQRIKLMEISELTRQFGTLLKAGIPVVDSLTALIAQTENPKLKGVVTKIRQGVNEGQALGSAMGEHPKVFTDLYVSMIRAGESSGTLDLVFDRLSQFMEAQVALRTKVRGAMIYPIIMIAVTFVIISLLMIFVVPKMTEIFTEMGMELPFLTVALIAVSDAFVNFWWLIFGGVGLGIWGFIRWKKGEKGRATFDRMKLKFPVFGDLFRKIAIARFSRTLSTLLRSGVPLLNAMTIVRSVVDNAVMAAVIDKARDAIREGESIAGPLERSKQFPPMVTHMIAIGEKTGELEDMLGNVSDSYEAQVDARVSALTTILEPFMIVFMGVVVATIVFAVLTPMLQMSDAFDR